MASLGEKFALDFERETWTLYGVGLLAACLRFFARGRKLGIRNLQVDDYLMVFAVVWYTMLCVALNEVASGGGSNLMDEYDIKHLTPAIHAERVSGSKWVFVSEHSYLLTTWTLKSCMLVIYARITEGLRQKRLIHYLAIYIGLGFIATELSLFLMCRPLSNYWAVPTPDYQCKSYQYYEIVQGSIAITCDILMLLVAIPILAKVRIPLKQKIILLIVFGMGIFVVIAAIMTKVYCLVPSLISYVYMNWYFREATVAMVVTNIPLIWSLLRELFPGIMSWSGSKKTDVRYRSGPWTLNRGTGRRRYGRGSEVPPQFSLHNWGPTTTINPTKPLSDTSYQLSDQDAMSEDASSRALKIRQEITVTVDSEGPSPAHTPSPHALEFSRSQSITSHCRAEPC